MSTPSKRELRALRSRAAKGVALEREVLDEIAALTEEHKLYVFRPETRCRVCTSDASDTVNRMLAHAMTYADILRSLAPINDLLPEGEKISYDSIREHAKRHFPIEQTSKAVYRRMVEKRAEQFDVDFVAGVGGALTPMAFYDVVMQKGFQNLVDDSTEVSVETALRAAAQLQELTRAEEEQDSDMGEMMLKVQLLVDAVKAVVPEDQWERIIEAVESGEVPAPSIEAQFDEIPDVEPLDTEDPDFPEGEI